MAIVVESTSTGSASATDTLTITKPTGLAEDDLLIASLALHEAGSGTSKTYSTPAGWTLVEQGSYTTETTHAVMWKYADGTDVAASNFTFTATGNASLQGALLRCTGHNPSNPVGTVDTEDTTLANSTNFSGSLTAYTPPDDGSLFLMLVGGWRSAFVSASVSGYTTSGVSYTELYDSSGAGSNTAVVASAYGLQATAAEVSSYSATFNTSMTDHSGILAVFIPPVDASGTSTLVTTDTTVFTHTGLTDASGTSTLVEATGVANTQSGEAIAPTDWTTTVKS